MGTIVIAVAVTAIIVAPITWFAAVTHRKNAYESKIGSSDSGYDWDSNDSWDSNSSDWDSDW